MRLIRKTTLSALLTVLVGLNLAVFAENTDKEPILTIQPLAKDSKLVLTVRNLNSAQTQILIKDAFSDQVFSKYVNEDQNIYMELFNLSKLNQGEYTFYVISGNTTLSQKFELNEAGEILVAGETVTAAITPDIRLREGKVEVRLANRLKEAISVSIFDNSGSLIHADSDYDKTDYGKSFNLSKLSGGDYTFKVQAGEKTFEKTIAIK